MSKPKGPSKVADFLRRAHERAGASAPVDMMRVQVAMAAIRAKLDELGIPARERRMALTMLATFEAAQAAFGVPDPPKAGQ